MTGDPTICKVHRKKPPLRFAAVLTTLADNVFASHLLFVVAARLIDSRHTADIPLSASTVTATYLLLLVRRICLRRTSGQQNN